MEALSNKRGLSRNSLQIEAKLLHHFIISLPKGTNPDIDYSILYKWCTYAWIIIGEVCLSLWYICDIFLPIIRIPNHFSFFFITFLSKGTNPDIEYSVLYRWCAYAWIILGLAFLTLVISFLSDAFTLTADKLEQGRMEKTMKRKGIEGGDGDHKGEEDMKVMEADMIEGDSEEMKDLQQNSSASSA